MGCGWVSGGFRVQGSEFRVHGSGVSGLGGNSVCFISRNPGQRFQGSGFRFRGSGFRVQGSGFRVQGAGFMVHGSGLRVAAFGLRETPGSRFEGR